MTQPSTSVDVYESTLDLAQAAARIAEAPDPVRILTHAKPDGDAFGSTIALAAALREMGRQPDVRFVPPVPRTLQALPGNELAGIHEPDAPPLPQPGFQIIVDTGAWSQLGHIAPMAQQALDRTLILDHHLSGDIPAAHRYIDGTAAAAAEIVSGLLEHLLAGITPAQNTRTLIASALFVGIASDTGWFRFSNTRPRTHQLAARLLEQGVDQAWIYQTLEQSERPAKLELLKRAVNSLQYVANQRAAIMVLRREDFEQTGAFEEETERLIDLPQQVGRLEVVALISEMLDDQPSDGHGLVRVSLRSKPGPQAVDVAELANRFDGGGHARAAGLRLQGPPDAAARRLAQALEQQMGH